MPNESDNSRRQWRVGGWNNETIAKNINVPNSYSNIAFHIQN